MPLDFRTREEEGFSIRRFLKTVGLGVGVFLAFMAVGYYIVGPRITVSEEGRVQLRLATQPPTEPSASISAPEARPLPKVEVYEKLSPEVTAGTGLLIGAREVAPFDYERYQQKRRARKSKTQPTPAPEETSETVPLEDEYFVPDDTPAEELPPAAEPPPTPPAEPPATPEPPPATPTPEPPRPPAGNPETALYRVQIGVYESRENANQIVQSLLASGFEASIVPFQRDGRTLYRVQTLVTRDKAKADALKAQLESRGFPAVVAKVQ